MSVSPFYFELTEKPASYEDVKKKVSASFSAPYKFYVTQFFLNRGPLVPFLFSLTSYSEKDDFIYFHFTDHADIKTPLVYANQFCYIYKFNMFFDDFNNLLCNVLNALGAYVSYKTYIKPKQEITEDGQAKIMISTLIPLVNAPQEVHILVIGSASEDNKQFSNPSAGRSYEALIDFLPKLNYRGSITMYDPYEQPRAYKKNNFCIETKRQIFSYNIKQYAPNKKEFTHIYDDVWQVTRVNPIATNVVYTTKYIKLHNVLKSKFAYCILKKKNSLQLYLTNDLKKHNDLAHAVGGGMMEYDAVNKTIIISGSSNRIPHYSRAVVLDALDKYQVEFKDDVRLGRFTWDPDNSLYKLYPNAIISAKYFGEDYSFINNKKIYSQIWYTGKEQRIVINHIVKSIGFWHGCGCFRCQNYAIIINGIRNYNNNTNDQTLIKQLLNSVIIDPCLYAHGTPLVRALNLINSFGHAMNSDYELVTFLEKRLNVHRDQAIRYIMFAVKFKRTNLSLQNFAVLEKHTDIVEVNGIKKYYHPKKNDYYVVRENSIEHYVNDIMVIDAVAYRPDVIVLRIEEVIKHFIHKYYDMINFVVTYPNLYGSGNYIVGFDNTYEVFLSRDTYDYVLLDEYSGWNLYFNKLPNDEIT